MTPKRDPLRDSDTYQAILDEGREEHAKAVILRLGQKKFGPAADSIRAKLSAITDLGRLRRMEDCLFDTATNWQDVLDTP